MTVSSTGNSSLDAISSSYQTSVQEQNQTEDALGRDAFLTMLVAQLENQDPLNPMDGTDFSAQLAQFSQLEQLMNLNDTLETLAVSLTKNTEENAMDYLGKQVTGTVDTMNVDDGTVTGGFYNLAQSSDVMVTITDASGTIVKTLYEGQQESGSHIISWDGTNSSGEAVSDGSYNYTVLANTGSGYEEVPSTVTGTVEGITYNNGKGYLVVQGIVLDPDSVTSVIDTVETSESGSADSIVSYLGRTISSTAPIVLVEDGAVSGSDLGFELESSEEVSINIYDAYDELVRTITVSAEDTTGGENLVHWDALADSGYQVSDGMYYYTVKTDDGYAKTPVSEEVSGIKYLNGSQYLVLNDSGRLVSVSKVTQVN